MYKCVESMRESEKESEREIEVFRWMRVNRQFSARKGSGEEGNRDDIGRILPVYMRMLRGSRGKGRK